MVKQIDLGDKDDGEKSNHLRFAGDIVSIAEEMPERLNATSVGVVLKIKR